MVLMAESRVEMFDLIFSDPGDLLVGSESCGGGEASGMHHCVGGGGGPLAMVTPLHSFDSHTSHSRLTEPEPEEVRALTSHQDLQPPTPDTEGTGPVPPVPPHFSDPSDQAQFEADKRQIYK